MSDAGQVREEKLDPEAEARRRVALAQIRQYPDPVLRMRAREVEGFDDELGVLIERLNHLLRDANGLGLAATQLGVLRRVFVFLPDPEQEPVALVNPRLVESSDGRVRDDEGCLSLQGVVIPVERHERVTIEASDPEGKELRLELEALPARVAQHELDHLLTRPDRPRGRGRRVGPPPAKETAERLGIEVRQPDRVSDFDPEEETVVLAAYGALIPEPLLERALWLNVHPSLLPRWRGAAPIERALMAGDRETGVTIIKLVPELDAGPIAAQRAFPIEPEDDYGAVAARAAELGTELLEDVLPAPTFTPQPEEGVTYAE